MPRIRTLPADPETAALLFPFLGRPVPPRDGGVILGPQLFGRAAVPLSPWGWQRHKPRSIIPNTECEITCMIGHGKTTLVKGLIPQLSRGQAEPIDGQPQYRRGLIDSQRREGKEDEYAMLVRAMNGLIVRLVDFGFNPFGKELYVANGNKATQADELDVLETAIILASTVDMRPIDANEALPFQIAVHQMLQADVPHPGYLELKLRNLDMDDVNTYFRNSNSRLEQQLLSQFPNRPDLAAELNVEFKKPLHIQPSDFRRDAHSAANRIGAVRRGVMGNTFGGTMSLHDIARPRMVLRDWTGMNELTQTALSAVLMHFENILIRQGRHDLLPHFHVRDEDHARINNPTYARTKETRKRMSRQVHTFGIDLNQYAGDTARIGDAGSRLRGHGQAIDRSNGFLIVGRQTNDPEICQYLASKGVREPDIMYITQAMPEYCFALLLPNWAPVFFRRNAGPTILNLAKTNSAAEGMTKPVNGYDDPERWARIERIRALETSPDSIEQEVAS